MWRSGDVAMLLKSLLLLNCPLSHNTRNIFRAQCSVTFNKSHWKCQKSPAGVLSILQPYHNKKKFVYRISPHNVDKQILIPLFFDAHTCDLNLIAGKYVYSGVLGFIESLYAFT